MGASFIDDIVADKETLANLPEGPISDKALAAIAHANFTEHITSGAPIIQNSQLAAVYGRDRGNVTRAMKLHLPVDVHESRSQLLAHIRGVRSVESLSPEELSERGFLGFMNGIGQQSTRKRKATAQLATERRNEKVPYGGCLFDSAPEAVVASFLKDGISDLRFRRGRTYQVPIKNNGTGRKMYADFCIRKSSVLPNLPFPIIIEYHEPMIWSQDSVGHFASEEEAQLYRSELRGLSGRVRSEREDEISDMLFRRYITARQEILDANHRYRGSTLLAARNKSEFYHSVLRELGIISIPEVSYTARFNKRIAEMLARRPSAAGSSTDSSYS